MKHLVRRASAMAMDSAMSAMMYGIQWRLRKGACTRQQMEQYLSTCAGLSRHEFYRLREVHNLRWEDNNRTASWDSPMTSGFPENDRTRVAFFPCEKGPTAPTVLLLHALMSASDIGYRGLAAWFNKRGWNAAFPHLPYHYSRKPKGTPNGALAVTANLVRNGETLRQGVMELRQLLVMLRARGGREFGLIGTSYGGWTGALLSFLEPDFRFMALIQPIVNIEYTIWTSPAAGAIRRQLRTQGIAHGISRRHEHLSSPMHGIPMCDLRRVILAAGSFDRVSPQEELMELNRRWTGSRLLTVPQGHFGYSALRKTMAEVEEFL